MSDIGWTREDSERRRNRVRAQSAWRDFRPIASDLLMHLECLVMAIDPDDCGIETSQAERAIERAKAVLND